MIYSIIPPILIVISLAGIVVFLIKKAPEVASLKVENFENNLVERKSFWSRITRRNKSEEEGLDFKHKLLLFLEKNTKKLKLLFLKLENIFSVWGESFRNKRKAHEEEKMAQLEEMVEEKNIFESEELKIETPRVEKIEKVEIKKEIKKPEPIKPIQPVQPIKPIQSEIIKPMHYVKEEKKVKPRIKSDKREILEKILVERIATNPRDTEAYEQLGEYYFDMDNLDYAKECFKQVLKIDPQNKSVKDKIKKLEKILRK